MKKEKNCKQCGKLFITSTDGSFCCRKCYHDSTIVPEKEYICEYCGKIFYDKINKDRKYCSLSCLQKVSGNILYTSGRETLIKKYGVNHPGKLKDHKLKIKKTKLEKYGDENYNNFEKNKQTKLEKYGDENYVNIKKTKQTKLEKYGDENYNNFEKTKQTKLEKYGDENYNNIETIIKTMNEKYDGVGLQSKILKEKINKTIFNKYNVHNISNIPAVIIKKKEKKHIQTLNYIFRGERIKTAIPLFLESEYAGCHKKYKFKCIQCNHKFFSYIRNGNQPRCPKCYPVSSTSQFEMEFHFWLKSLNINFIVNDRTIIPPLELDIYIPEYKIAIELNGMYWHSELRGRDRLYHLNKTNKCLENGIRLIHIFDDEWINKKEIIKSKLKSILKISDSSIYARKCVIKEISAHEKNDFLNLYHIQGQDVSSIYYGSFYLNELIGVMTFCKPRFALGNRNQKFEEYELSRFATKTNCVGLASKFLKFFINTIHPKKIYSYADKRWSSNDNNLYTRIGFNIVSETPPNYWYTKNYVFKEHRFKYRKQVLSKILETFDPKLTEWENMQINGYDRIWDCGNIKYEMNIK